MTLLPAMKLRLAAPLVLIDLAGLDDLNGIGPVDNEVAVGAMTVHREVAGSERIRTAIPALAALAGGIGDVQVRNRGTLGGSVSNNDPAADYPAAILGLNATITTTRRQIVADEFFTGLFDTILKDNEIICHVSFPVPELAAYVKFSNPASRYAIVGVMVAKRGEDIRVAVTGAGACVFRVPELEQALAADFTPAALTGIEFGSAGLNEDLHASAKYRAHLITVLTRRAVEAALGR
jgi:carbon-monoxide dehydrogenase medium subunit